MKPTVQLLRDALQYYADGKHIQYDKTGLVRGPYVEPGHCAYEAIAAYEDMLAATSQQADGEPVAWRKHNGQFWAYQNDAPHLRDNFRANEWEPLYAAPLPAQPQGQGAEPMFDAGLAAILRFIGQGYDELLIRRIWDAARIAMLTASPPSQAPEPAQQEAAGEEEPVGYLHRHGNHTEVSERRLEEGEIARGWTQEPLYTAPPPAQSQEPVAYVNDMGIGRALSWQPLKESFGHRALIYADSASLPSPAPQAAVPDTGPACMISLEGAVPVLPVKTVDAALASPVVSDSEIAKVAAKHYTTWDSRIFRFARDIAALSRTAPVGWKLVPDADHMTDEQAEAIAKVANCCGGIAYSIYCALLAASPSAAQGEGT